MNTAEALEYLQAAMYEVESPTCMARTIASGRDTFRVSVTASPGSDLRSTQSLTMVADVVCGGRNQTLEFKTSEVRDILGFHVHLAYMASYGMTSLDRKTVNSLQIGFESRGKRVVMPYLQEDEVSWIGRDAGDRIVLATPVVHYGHDYVDWREKVCAAYDRIVLPTSHGTLRLRA